MRARIPGAALALGTLLPLLCIGEARGAAVCSNTPGANDRVVCQRSDATDIDIDLTNPAIATTVDNERGVYARHTNTGTGKIDVVVTGGSLSAAGQGGYGVFTLQEGAGGVSIALKGAVQLTTAHHGVFGLIQNAANTAAIAVDVTGGSIAVEYENVDEAGAGVWVEHQGGGGIDIDLAGVAVSTTGHLGYGVYGRQRGAGGTGVDIDVSGGSIKTAGTGAHGVGGDVRGGSTGAVSIDVTDVEIETTGTTADGVFGMVRNATGEKLSIAVTRGSISTEGARLAHGIRGRVVNSGSDAALSIEATDVEKISTTGQQSFGIWANHGGTGRVDVQIKDVDFSTTGWNALGVFGDTGNGGAVFVDVTGGRIVTTGEFSYGVYARNRGLASEAAISVVGRRGAAIATTGTNSYGFYARHYGMGAIDIDLADIDIATAGANAYGVYGWIQNTASEAAISIDVQGGDITAAGLSTRGLFGYQQGLGSVSMTAGAALTIEAPFAAGMEARLTNDASAAGRILMTHRGAIKARDVGVLAWAGRSGGHTFGAGEQMADDAARTAPMIHVTSSGDVTVGASVMDAFIREVVAGTDGTLSTAENAVLSAVTAGDSDALDTALGALPADYDDDYKAEARDLLSSRRGTMPPPAKERARQVAEEILEIPRAGIRALALEHVAIADHVRNGDRDPTILAIEEASRTEQQKATLAEQEKLSAAERTVLEAALKGSGLETALAALSATTYTDDWKDEVRRHAASYNAGGIRVDVTGGTITSDGDGVYARYVLTHDRNGAIAVTVAEGASVTGGRSGLYVGGAGAGEGNSRNQRVTVNGAVMGGTGAGVRVAGGGELDVGRTGRIGASSGVGVLADGTGDFQATVAGTVEGDILALGDGDLTAMVTGTVDGDVEGLGGGDHTVAVPVGGTVTGTVRLDGSTVTVGGTVGRITLNDGGTVRVASTGQVTGVSAGSHGVSVGPGGTIENHGTITGTSHGVSIGRDGTIENHGTIEGTIGIEAGAGSTVVNSGTVRSTKGGQGIAMNFQPGPGKNMLTLRRGITITGKIRGLGQRDTVDLSDLAVDELGLLCFVDAEGNPVTPTIREPRPGGVGRLIRSQARNALVGLDTTAFALTDDVLSDLTGSIHAAVLGTGRPAQAHEGDPAQRRVWAAPFGGWREQTGTGSLADGTHTFGGGLVGAGWGTPALYVGGFIGGSAGQLAVAGSRQNVNVDMQTVFGGAYAQRALKNGRADARVLVGHVDHDATRRVNPGTAHAAYTAFLVSPEVGAALRVPVTPTLHAMPRLRVRYAGLFTEGFRERAPGGNWDVGFAARSVQILEGRGEVSVPITLENGGHVAPRLGLEGRWLLAGEMVEGTLPGGAFQTSAGGDQAVATGTLGLGLRLPVAAGATLVGNFDGALTTEHAWRATGYLGLTYSF